MKIQINDSCHEIPDSGMGLMLADVLQVYDATPPYAVALNGDFVPQDDYAKTPISAGDCLDVVSPVFGG